MAYVSPSGIVRAADRTTEVDGRRRDAATRRTGPAPVTSREVSVPADPEEDVNSSDIEPAVALDSPKSSTKVVIGELEPNKFK